ncbi:Fes1-domain-containing protein, partial [Sistotremastrum suecicum HHB10207 ss-3]
MAGLESLLTWSIANSSPTAPPPDPQKLKSLDPGIIDLILGKPDAVRMKESLTLALDEEKEEEERVDALDELEMLVEQIDNANNLTPLGMWTPLLELLHSTESSKIRIQLLWILGTAVQNNPKAQSDFLTYNPLPKILSLLSATETPDAATRSKAVYTLSATLKHSRAAVEQLSNENGWEVIRGAITDPDLSVRRKTVFMLFNLL